VVLVLKVCWKSKIHALNVFLFQSRSDRSTGWGSYFTETGLFEVEYLDVEDDELRHPEIRMTLDYPEDYEFFKAVFNELYSPGKVFTLKKILTLLRRKPHIMEINKHLQQKYTERIQKHAKVKLKKGFQDYSPNSTSSLH